MGVKFGVLNTAIYGKIVRCSFKSFEQYTFAKISRSSKNCFLCLLSYVNMKNCHGLNLKHFT